MKFLTGKGTIAGASQAILVSQSRTLLQFSDGSFAVRRGVYLVANCPYLVAGATVTVTVSIDGHSVIGYDDSTTADYDVFTKSTRMLPNTCIESAEHVLKCMHANAHSTALIDNGTMARVSMSAGGSVADIDADDMNETAFGAFPHGLDGIVDATLTGFAPGDGMALVYSLRPDRRGKAWTCHAVAILLKSLSPFGPFVVVSEVFAPDDGSDVQMTQQWGLGFYQHAQDFRDAYAKCMPPSKYTLWKLSAAHR